MWTILQTDSRTMHCICMHQLLSVHCSIDYIQFLHFYLVNKMHQQLKKQIVSAFCIMLSISCKQQIILVYDSKPNVDSHTCSQSFKNFAHTKSHAEVVIE